MCQVKKTNPINPEAIKAWEDFKNHKFLDGDIGEVSKNSRLENKSESFIGVLDERKSKKYINKFTFIGIKKTKIEKVDKKDNFYTVKTRFISEIISCVKDEKNNVIEGSSEEIQTVNDVWSFSRDLNSEDPTWHLTEIAQDVHGKE